MNKYETYFGQVVTDDELNEIFNSYAEAIESFVEDFGFVGIAVGADVTQNSSPNLTVNVSGPAIVYDQTGHRISFGPTINVNVAADEVNVATAVVSSGNSKWLSIFVKYIETPSDPRVDDLGATVFFRKLAGYEIHVVQGAESSASPTRPALRGDQILLADVQLSYGQVSVATGNISNSRAQVIYNFPGTPFAILGKNIQAAFQQIVTGINNITGTTITVPAITGSPVSLAGGTLASQLAAFLAAFNAYLGSVPSLLNLAYTNVSNTFTQPQNINSVDAASALVGTDILPDDAGAGHASNHWKLIFKWRIASGSPGNFIRMYSGRNASDGYGAFALTINAEWSVANQRWDQFNSDTPSGALILLRNRLRFASQPSGTANWTDWLQSNNGKFEVPNIDVGTSGGGGGLLAVLGNAAQINVGTTGAGVGGAINILGDLGAIAAAIASFTTLTANTYGGNSMHLASTIWGGSLKADATIQGGDTTVGALSATSILLNGTGPFARNAKTRTTYLNLRDGISNVIEYTAVNTMTGATTPVSAPSWKMSVGAGYWEFWTYDAVPPHYGFFDIPIRLPLGSVLTGYEVSWQAPTVDAVLETRLSLETGFGNTASRTDSISGTEEAGISVTSGIAAAYPSQWATFNINGFSELVETDKVYSLRINAHDPGAGVRVNGVRITWTDNGAEPVQ